MQQKEETAMPLLVRAFPIVVPLSEVQGFFAALRARSAEVDAFYRRYGVSEERVFLQEVEPGKYVLIVVTTIADTVKAAAEYGPASGTFEKWFKEKILSFSGVDANVQPLGPPVEEVFTWPPEGA
jgi:hypothetical protein